MKKKWILLFDLGGVLEYHMLDKLSVFLAKKSNSNPKEFYKFMLKNLRYNDKCAITDGELIKRLNKKFKLKLTINSYYKYYYKYIKQNQNMLKLIRKLKKQCKLVIFSNTRKLHLKGVLKHVNYRRLFDHIFISQNLCTRKPELKYYKLFLKIMRANPKNCIFIDDKERNFPPARKLGIHCIKFKSINDLKKKLKKFDIAVE